MKDVIFRVKLIQYLHDLGVVTAVHILLFENAKANGIFELIDTDLVFENESTNKIKMNHIKTMLCGHFIGIDKLERLKY